MKQNGTVLKRQVVDVTQIWCRATNAAYVCCESSVIGLTKTDGGARSVYTNKSK